MKDSIWLEKDLDLKQTFADGDFDTLIAYSDENQKNLLYQWMNNKSSFVSKMLRFGSGLLHYFERSLLIEPKLHAAFRTGALLGTIEGLEQLIHEEEQGEWIYKEFKEELSSIKHLEEVILILQLYGVLNHSEMCRQLDIKDSTLTEIMKRIEPTKLVQSTKSGKYKLYTLTDAGRRLGQQLRKQRSDNMGQEEILSKLKECFEQTSDKKKFRRRVEDIIEENSLGSLYSGNEVSMFYMDDDNKVKIDRYKIEAALITNTVNDSEKHFFRATKNIEESNVFDYDDIYEEGTA